MLLDYSVRSTHYQLSLFVMINTSENTSYRQRWLRKIDPWQKDCCLVRPSLLQFGQDSLAGGLEENTAGGTIETNRQADRTERLDY